MILSLDTTSEFGGVALTNGSGTVDSISIHAPEGFGTLLIAQIDALLARNRCKISDVECFAAASGPGSFTGVRVGLAAVKGLAEATKRKVVAASNLQAMASFGTAPLRATVLDARRGEVYGAVYDSHLRLVVPETVMRLEAWLLSLPASELEFIAVDSALIQKPVTIAPKALAEAVGRIAWMEWMAGRALDPVEIDANYVRRSDAELFWKE